MQLETERLILRPVEEEDAHAVYLMRSDPDVTFNLLSGMRTVEEAVSWVTRCRKALECKEGYQMAITLKEDGRMIGVCSLLRVSWDHLNAELVYWIGKEFWGKGYMTEAAGRLIKFGFEDLGLERIGVGCFARNKASARVIEKLGFRYEGLARHQFRKDGEFLDELRFSMLREDFTDASGD